MVDETKNQGTGDQREPNAPVTREERAEDAQAVLASKARVSAAPPNEPTNTTSFDKDAIPQATVQVASDEAPPPPPAPGEQNFFKLAGRFGFDMDDAQMRRFMATEGAALREGLPESFSAAGPPNVTDVAPEVMKDEGAVQALLMENENLHTILAAIVRANGFELRIAQGELDAAKFFGRVSGVPTVPVSGVDEVFLTTPNRAPSAESALKVAQMREMLGAARQSSQGTPVFHEAGEKITAREEAAREEENASETEEKKRPAAARR